MLTLFACPFVFIIRIVVVSLCCNSAWWARRFLRGAEGRQHVYRPIIGPVDLYEHYLLYGGAITRMTQTVSGRPRWPLLVGGRTPVGPLFPEPTR